MTALALHPRAFTRAEQLEDVRMRPGTVLRRAVLRPVYCPSCGTHRTLLVDRATWTGSGGVKHVRCSAPRCRAPSCACCAHGGKYNGFGSDGPLAFTCPKDCMCHD